MIKFRAKLAYEDMWTEGVSLIKTLEGYYIVNQEMEWCDGVEWISGDSIFWLIDIETLIIEYGGNKLIQLCKK
jgi:hypothetical protein